MLLFVYGTLMYDPILRALINRAPEKRAAVLQGYARRKIHGALYPAIISVEHHGSTAKTAKSAAAQASTHGFVIDVTETELDLIDQYESIKYTRVKVKVTLTGVKTTSQGGNDGAECFVYVWTADQDKLGGEWLTEEFESQHYHQYLRLMGISA